MIRALILAAVFALIAAGPANAHAVLEGTTPERGAQLDTAPGQVVLRFSEPVEIALGSVRVYDARGREVQAGAATHPRGGDRWVAVRLQPGLPDGGYTVTYRVVSADSHPVSGGFVFSVGAGGPAAATTVSDLLDDRRAGPVTSVAFAAVRTVQDGAIAVGIGALALLVLVCSWRSPLRSPRAASGVQRPAASRAGGVSWWWAPRWQAPSAPH